MTEQEIEENFEKALKECNDVSEISQVFHWGFDDIQIKKLVNLHKEKPELRNKIEDLFTDCNYHRDVKYLHAGRYEEYLKERG